MSALPLARLLADGELHSGAALAARLGLTRAAVWRQVARLPDYGLAVQRLHGRGYRLDQPLSLLDPARIVSALRAAGSALDDVRVFDSVSSTHDVLAAPGAPDRAVCLAEHQSAGRGRRGRRWQSPFGVNLYVSVSWGYDAAPASLSGLSLALGVGLAGMLRERGVDVRIKWPNDLWLDRRKLGGLLVEVSGDAQGPCRVVVGVGLNVNMQAPLDPPDQPWASLAGPGGPIVDRSTLAAETVRTIETVLMTFPEPGFAAYRDAWRAFDALAGAQVEAEWAGELLHGRVRGIAADGGLEIDTAAGPRVLRGGEVSVRAHGPAA